MEIADTLPSRVLIVAAHELIKEGLRAMLETDPELSVIAETAFGDEARRLAADHTPDLLLLEVHPPNERALETVRALKTRHPEIKIVAIGSADDESLVAEAMEAGASGFLGRDCSSSLLCHALHAVKDGAFFFAAGPSCRSALRRAQVNREAGHRLSRLSSRERTILRLLALGKSNRDIARSLFLSESTVKKCVHAIFLSLQVGNRTEAAMMAAQSGLLADDEVEEDYRGPRGPWPPESRPDSGEARSNQRSGEARRMPQQFREKMV